MKDSGIEWIGEIPKNKNIIRNKYLLEYTKGKLPVDTNFESVGFPYIGATDLDSNELCKTYTCDETLPDSCDSDLLVLWDGARAGLCGTHKVGKVSSTIVRIREVDSTIYRPFLYWYYKGFEDYMYQRVNGTTIPHMNRKYIEEIEMIDWTVQEQRHIVDYLDRKCSQIDAIIARQQKVIEKLKAYKLSVITEAVTKGLNPDVPMKDSGDGFIGVMPEHWNVAKLGMLFDFLGGCAYISDSYTSESDNQVIRIGNVKSGYMALENNPVYISDEIASVTDKFRINPGSILFTMTGTKGKRDYFFTHLVTEEDCKGKKLFLNQRVGCFIPKESIDAGYYSYLLKENRILDAIFVYETGTANQGNLGIESIRRTKVQLPSKDEQIKIREYLDNRCAKIEGLLIRKSEIICRLMTYKKSLIYEVVTGKKEV